MIFLFSPCFVDLPSNYCLLLICSSSLHLCFVVIIVKKRRRHLDIILGIVLYWHEPFFVVLCGRYY